VIFPGRPLQPVLAPDPPLLERKFEEHRAFGAAMSLMCALAATGLWIWDRTLDPQGARGTLAFRLAFFGLFSLYGLVAWRVRRRSLVAALGLAQVLAGEALFLLILGRLRAGMVWGVGGFMFFFLIPLVLFQGFSLRVNLLYTFLAAALPQLLALAGLAPGFRHAQYAVLIWPAALVTAAAQTSFALGYLARYRSERTLEEASNTDPLTGLSNRRHFMPLLAQELNRCRRFRHSLCLLMLDIDRFKAVNDTYGHPTGDLVIRRVAEACRRRSRESDAVARLGGEEFAVLLAEASLKGALAFAERIREDVEGMAVLGPGRAEVRFTVSIGVAELDPAAPGEDDLLRRADAALYRAKGEGRNRVSPSPSGRGPS
jgi:diguanylate cyclase (GGDEF)-like protein